MNLWSVCLSSVSVVCGMEAEETGCSVSVGRLIDLEGHLSGGRGGLRLGRQRCRPRRPRSRSAAPAAPNSPVYNMYYTQTLHLKATMCPYVLQYTTEACRRLYETSRSELSGFGQTKLFDFYKT